MYSHSNLIDLISSLDLEDQIDPRTMYGEIKKIEDRAWTCLDLKDTFTSDENLKILVHDCSVVTLFIEKVQLEHPEVTLLVTESKDKVKRSHTSLIKKQFDTLIKNQLHLQENIQIRMEDLARMEKLRSITHSASPFETKNPNRTEEPKRAPLKVNPTLFPKITKSPLSSPSPPPQPISHASTSFPPIKSPSKKI